MSERGRAYRRWKTFSKYVSRIKKRLYSMNVEYAEIDCEFNGIKYKRKFWRKPESWKEVEEKSSGGTKYLKKTPVMFKEPWKPVYDRQAIKEIREESKRIIDDELNNNIKE